jgi:hypothetical protein
MDGLRMHFLPIGRFSAALFDGLSFVTMRDQTLSAALCTPRNFAAAA